jgi:hypothetical protein
MKTIRDYINLVENAQSQVDEMNRRDFLQGAGAAAVGLGGIAYLDKNRKAEQEFKNTDYNYLVRLLVLYEVSKRFTLRNIHGPEDKEVFDRCKALIQRYIAANPELKPKVNELFKTIPNYVDNNQKGAVNAWEQREDYMHQFEKFVLSRELDKKDKPEFEEDLSETSQEAIAKIDSLVKK